MSDLENMDFESADEINKIQQEIDRDLEQSYENQTVIDLNPIENEIFVPMDEPETSSGFQSEAPASEKPKENIYSETVKHETYNTRKSKFKRVVAMVCVASVLGGSFLGLGIGVGIPVANNIIIPKLTGKTIPAKPVEPEVNFSFDNAPKVPLNSTVSSSTEDLALVVEKVEPSVVGITSVVQNSAANSYFFSTPYPQEGQGSGIIFFQNDENVFIVTNNHVVTGANEVRVSVTGKDPVPAKLVGRESQSDLAVISVQKSDLATVGITQVSVADFGNSDETRVGETVLAIGNALGEGNTATRGIISAKNKEIHVEDRVLTVIQTDAAINPGNSGGPLINTKGEIIGINTAKLSESSVEAMGYSITSNVAKPIIEELITQKAKPFLGVQGDDLTAEIAKQYNLPAMGVIVISVVEGSSAQKAGIMRGDVITGFNGQSVLTFEQLSKSIKECNIGDEVEVKIFRDGKTPLTLKVKLSENTQTGF